MSGNRGQKRGNRDPGQHGHQQQKNHRQNEGEHSRNYHRQESGGEHQNRGGFSQNPRGCSQNQRGCSQNQRGHSQNQRGHSQNQRGHSQNPHGHTENEQWYSQNQQGHSKNEWHSQNQQQGHPQNGQKYSQNQRGYPQNQRGHQHDQQYGNQQHQHAYQEKQKDHEWFGNQHQQSQRGNQHGRGSHQHSQRGNYSQQGGHNQSKGAFQEGNNQSHDGRSQNRFQQSRGVYIRGRGGRSGPRYFRRASQQQNIKSSKDSFTNVPASSSLTYTESNPIISTISTIINSVKSSLFSNKTSSVDISISNSPSFGNLSCTRKQKTSTSSNFKENTGIVKSQKKIMRRSRKKKNENLWNKKKVINQPGIQPQLLSFTRGQQEKTIVSDDDETMSTVSLTSSPDPEEQSDADTDDSEISSTISHPESITNMSSMSVPESIVFQGDTPGESFISVCWDIENCPVPQKKSAVDIVKKIRDVFYEGRTEHSFRVACDIRKLNPIIERELNECDVTVIHANPQDKNAADLKLQKFLLQFQYEFRNKGAAVVLVSGDSDFSHFLCDMRYKHNIHVSLLCNTMARKALRDSAHKCILYEDFIRDLSDRPQSELHQYIVKISNLPDYVKEALIKNCLSDKVKSINCRVNNVSSTAAEILCSNESTMRKALTSLEGFCVYGVPVTVTHEIRAMHGKGICEPSITNQVFSNVPETTVEKKLKIKTRKAKSVKEEGMTGLDSCVGKGAALQVYVGEKGGDVTFWQLRFHQMFNNKDIALDWCNSGFISYFIIKFTSLSKAQKARKILEKLQKNDLTAPKFLKLIKEEDGQNLKLVQQVNNLKDLAIQKIEKHIYAIEAKKNSCLNKFQNCLKNMRDNHNSSTKNPDSAVENSLFISRQNDMNEQKVAFLNFTKNSCERLNSLDTCAEDIDGSIEAVMKDFYQECVCFESGLPIYVKKHTIIKKVRTHQVVIIEAETGSGKTTQISQYLYRANFGAKGTIICTQPRKIAAMSVAKYVSAQIGCSLGSIVGYRVGSNFKMSEQTKILYVTDFTMLRMCSENPLLEDISCLVIDEAHERTIYTDLVIGMIKRSLSQRNDLRVIITSATLKVNLFQQYFSLPDEAILRIPGRVFPIEDIWLKEMVSKDSNYFEKCISVTSDIINEEPGDVLVFLTTPVETERAVDKFKDLVKSKKCNLKLIVLPLHGKLDVNEQQKVFEKTPVGTRKIIFATNCAETSITIPGIRYVVDSGMVKEAQYDSVRNMNILAVDFVNRSSAEQRRGRAGRTQNGKCYRLYNRHNYDNDMKESMVPEILRVNLGQALLRLLQLGVNPLDFHFVEAPSKASLTSALQQLVHLGAVDNLSLTFIGSQMAMLPLEPRLCYLILKGIELGIGYDAVVVACVATISRNIFFRNTNNRDEADRKKVRFCQSESDFLTFLEVFKEWSEVPKREKGRWCISNCINGRSMRLAQDLITELLSIFLKDLEVKLVPKYSSDDSLFKILHKLIFQSFSENLCMYSGHNRLGYFSLQLNESLYVHPSSSLNALGQGYPRYIVYDTILKTSEVFLLNITVVNDELLEEGTTNGFVVDLPRLDSLCLQPFVFQGLGRTTLQELIGVRGCNIKPLESTLKELCKGKFCAIDASFNSGSFTVHSFSEYHSAIYQVFGTCIENIQTKLYEREITVPNVSGINGLAAVIGAGGNIKDVILPGEFRDIIVKPVDLEISVLRETFGVFGEIASVEERKTYKNVVFHTVDSAKRAVKAFQSNGDFEVKPGKSYQHTENIAFFKISLSAIRRSCVGRAFFSISPISSLPIVSSLLTYKVLHFKSRQLTIRISKKCPTDFCIEKLPENFMETELKSFIVSQLPSDITVSKFIVERQKPFPSSETDKLNITEQIKETFSVFTSPEKLRVEVKFPRPTDKEWKAIIFFDNPHDGQNAINTLNIGHRLLNHQLSNILLQIKPFLETVLHCNKDIYKAIEDDVKEALEFFKKTSGKNELKINGDYSNDGSRVFINIESNNLGDISDAKKSIQQFIQGDQINCEGNKLLLQLFTPKGKAFLKKLMAEVGKSHIISNYHSKIISIFGKISECSIIKARLNGFLDDLAMELKGSKEISLRCADHQRSLLKDIIKEYDLDLQKLCSFCNLSAASVDVRKHLLIISGSENSLKKCQEVISNMFSELTEGLALPEDTELCPVCTDKVSDLSYRLELCGHAYCETCLLFQMQNDDCPILCCAQDCNQLVVINDILWASKKLATLQKSLWQRSFDVFMKNSSSIKYCPTPDCSMVYRMSSVEEDSRTTCPSCENDICTKCSVPYHVSLSCDLYQNLKDDDDYSLKLWMAQEPEYRKFCPSCRTPIEKDGGCMYMSCWKCRCHMCWRCMKLFSSDDEVYNHQSVCSG